MLLAAPAARAFTIDSNSMTNSDGTPKFTDPDKAVEQFGSGSTLTQPGSGTFHFGVRPSYGIDQRDRFNPPPGPETFPDKR
jgi:hypothetical protein